MRSMLEDLGALIDSGPAFLQSLDRDLLMAQVVCLVTLAITIGFGKPAIKWLKNLNVNDGQARKASETLNKINSGKESVPTMGGIFMVLGIVVASLLFLPLHKSTSWFALIAIVGSALIGMYDDWIKLRRKKDRDGKAVDGMRGRLKLTMQILLFGVCATAVYMSLPHEARILWIPLVNESVEIGWLLIPFAVFVCVGSSNAVNLADGLDGLAAGMTAMVALALALAGWAIAKSDTLNLEFIPYLSDAVLLSSIIAGACLGFLFYNRHPAKVFMGDTGSLALGAGLGMIAVCMRLEILLAVAGAMFVVEAMSVILQVAYFKLTNGKRIFRCSPLHHHFQFLGWPEKKVTGRFWAACAVFCLIGIFMLAAHGQDEREIVPLAEDSPVSQPVPDAIVSVSR